MGITITLNLKDVKNNVTKKFFGYVTIEEATEALKNFYDKRTYKYPINNEYGSFVIVGDINLEIK
jgi:hypothetical protein